MAPLSTYFDVFFRLDVSMELNAEQEPCMIVIIYSLHILIVLSLALVERRFVPSPCSCCVHHISHASKVHTAHLPTEQ